jgi:sialic acid synthase SpsE
MNGWSWNWYDGWSSHEDGYLADIAALISMSQNGKSTYIEKHVTLDRAAKGTDHSFAFTPPMMHDLKDKLEKIEEMYGIRPSSSERGEQGYPEEKC